MCKTLIFADFHLGTGNAEDLKIIIPWFTAAVSSHKPTRVVFDGDIFELILPVDHTSANSSAKTQCILLQEIIETWNEFFDFLNSSAVKEYVFVSGEHDYELRLPELEVLLKQRLASKNVQVTNHYYDAYSKTLVIHGSELDYNRIFVVQGEKISCIDGLTIAIDRFLEQTPETTRKIKKAAAEGIYSYWYAAGRLPQFIRSTELLFGCDKDVYIRECGGFFRSGALDRWLLQQKDWWVRCVGWFVKTIALYPPVLLWCYALFFCVLERKVFSRMKKIVQGETYLDEPAYCQSKDVRHLIVGHFHEFWQQELPGGKQLISLGSPRLHVAGIQNTVLKTFRVFSYVVISGEEVHMFQDRIDWDVPVEQIRKSIFSD